MKPHVVIWLRPGTPHREVGSWLGALQDPTVAGPPFHADVDRVLTGHPGGVLVVHDHDPARTDGWSEDERALGLDRKFRVISLTVRPFGPDLLADLAALPVVERVEPGRLASAGLPLASSLARQTGDWASTMIGVAEAHQRTLGNGVTVAVLDTGADLQHPEYADRLGPGFDFVDILDGAGAFLGDALGADADPTDPGVGHGSHVIGIVAAQGQRMPRGVAPECRVLPVRVLGALRQDGKLIGAGLVDNINAGIKWAVDHGADVINMSLGIQHDGGGLPHVDVVRYAARKGVVVVAAAGNDGAATLYYPGALPGVIAVGAIDRDGATAPYSTWGPQVDLVGPGTEIWSSWVDGGYAFATGTSQATPFVTGAVALCQSLARRHGRRLRPAQIADLLTASADRADRRFKTPQAGSGRLNVPDALRLAQHRLDARRTAHHLLPGRQPEPVLA